MLVRSYHSMKVYTSTMLGCRMRVRELASFGRIVAHMCWFWGPTLLDRCWARLRTWQCVKVEKECFLEQSRYFVRGMTRKYRDGVACGRWCTSMGMRVFCSFARFFGQIVPDFAMLVCTGILGVITHRQHVLVRQELAWYINENTKRVYRWNAFRGGRDCYPTA